jgi:chromosome segregation ATPase
MGLGSLWCYVWWLALGGFLSWLLWWLIDKLFLRDTETPVRLAEAEADIDALRALEMQRRAEIDELQNQVNVAGNQALEISRLKSELDRYKGLEEAFEAEYNKIAAENAANLKLTSDARAEIDTLKADIGAAKARVAEMDRLSTELEQARTRSDATTRELSGVSAELVSARSEIEKLKEQLAAGSRSDGERDSLRRSLEDKDTEIARLKKEWSEATAHSASLANLKIDLDRNVERLRTQDAEIETLKGVLIDSKNVLERQASDIQRLKSELAASPRLSERTSELETELAAARGSEAQLRSELARANARIASLDKLRQSLEAARAAAAGHASEVARLNEEFYASLNAETDPEPGKS